MMRQSDIHHPKPTRSQSLQLHPHTALVAQLLPQNAQICCARSTERLKLQSMVGEMNFQKLEPFSVLKLGLDFSVIHVWYACVTKPSRHLTHPFFF